MRIEYDINAKAVYIALRNVSDSEVAHTKELVPHAVFLDKNRFGQVVGIEVLGVEAIEDITKVNLVEDK